MRVGKLVVFVSLVFISCQTSENLSQNFYEPRKVSVINEGFILKTSTPWFSDELVTELDETEYVLETGSEILSDIIHSYENQTFGTEKVNQEESNVVFHLRKLTIKRGYFTLNFPNPGPIYKISFEIDIYEKGIKISSEKYKARVNMSEVNFADEPYKWLDIEERKNPEYQLATLNTGLRRIYQKLYFNYFDISLVL